jgi:outer membrane protein assembly factor BamB
MQGKLDRRTGSVNFRNGLLYATLISALFTTGCLHPARRVTNISATEWTGTLGGVQRTPFLLERVPPEPSIQWEARFGRGYTDVPFVSNQLLIGASSAKTITVANPANGSRFWERRVNGIITGALLRLNERLYVATQSRDGRVEAFRLEQGRHAWTFKMHSPATGGPVIVDSTLFVGSERGEFFALNIDHGEQLWRVRIPAPLAAAPVPWGGDLFVVTARDSLLRVDRTNGTVSPGILLSGSSSAPIALAGDRLLIPVQPGTIQAVHAPDMRVEWTAHVGAPVLAAPALDANGDIYVLTRTADVWRISAAGAAQRVARLGGAASGSLTLTADGIIVGRLDGSIIMIQRDGTVLWQRNFTHSVRTPVAVRNGSIYVPLGDGHLVMLR